MRALSSRTFCPFDSRRVSLWYLPARLRYTTPVVGMLEITVVKGRLDAGVGRGQPDVACAVGQPERTRDTCHLLRWHVTVQVLSPYTGDALLPFVDHRSGPQHHVVDGAG